MDTKAIIYGRPKSKGRNPENKELSVEGNLLQRPKVNLRPEETPHVPQEKYFESNALESVAKEEQFRQAERQLNLVEAIAIIITPPTANQANPAKNHLKVQHSFPNRSTTKKNVQRNF